MGLIECGICLTFTGDFYPADMNMYAIISTMLSILWCYLGYKTVKFDNRNRVYLLFGALCLAMTIWTFFIGIAYSMDRIEVIHILLKISYTGGFLYSPIILHFFMLISKTTIRPCFLVMNYLPYLILTVANWIDFFIFSSLTRYNSEWLAIINTDSILVHFYVLSLFCTFTAALIVLFKWNKKAMSNKEKKQSGYIAVFFSICFCTSYVLTLILPYFRINELQFIGIAVFDFFIIGLFFLISRFRFMNLQGALPPDEIISHMSEFVFVLDNDLRIIECNRGARLLQDESGFKRKNSLFTDIIVESGEFNSSIRSVLSGEVGNFTALINYRTETRPMHTKAYVSGIKDRFNDISGVLVISSEIRDIRKFQKTFRITDRELEVTGLVASGLTYKEISEKLGISERTVERHLTNIYNKLGISNRIELFRIAGEYNIRI